MAETVFDLAGSWVASEVGPQNQRDPEAERMAVMFQKADWHCLPWAIGHYAMTGSARPHVVVG